MYFVATINIGCGFFMLLYSKTITARLQYTARFVGQVLSGKPMSVTDNKEEWINYNDVKINYTGEKILAKEIWVLPITGLLFHTERNKIPINCDTWNGATIFFKTENGDIPFDIFSATFYLISRYEEYLPHNKDEYGRYAHTNSIAFKEGFLDKPLVNLWLKEFRKLIEEKFPTIALSSSGFKFIPTYDIDEAYAYKHRPLWHNAAAAVRDLIKGDRKKFTQRYKIITGKEADIFDAYEWMDDLHKKCRMNPVYFFLLAEKQKGYDKNISPHSGPLKKLIEEHAEKYETVIHPSWQSGDDKNVLKKEIALLGSITKKQITKSRQHYIRLRLPHTYRLLIENGITEDYSMGYGSINGFRASVASSFYWYDLENEKETQLLLHPFCFMDANSYYEQKQTAEETEKELQQYYQQVNNVSGTLITIWHNNFLGTEERFKGWREVWERFAKKMAE